MQEKGYGSRTSKTVIEYNDERTIISYQTKSETDIVANKNEKVILTYINSPVRPTLLTLKRYRISKRCIEQSL